MQSIQGILRRTAALLSCALLLSGAAGAQSSSSFRTALIGLGETANGVTATIVANRSAATPGGNYEVGILLTHKPGWHTYWKNPGDSGLPTQIEWTIPKNWKITSLGWPMAKRLKTGPLTSFVYEDKVLLPFKVEVPWGTPYGTRASLTAKVTWLSCKDVCVPGEASLKFSTPIKVASEPTPFTKLFAATKAAIPERVASTTAKAVYEGNLLRIDLPQSAGHIEKEVVFVPNTTGVLDLSAPARTKINDKVTQLYLKLRDTVKPTSLEGILIADQGPSKGGWAIETTIPVSAGTVLTQKPLEKPKIAKLREVKITLPPAEESVDSQEALALAFFGGLILNLMPCVFPILSLKVLHLVDSSRRTGSLASHGMAFTAGVIVSVLLLAGGLLTLRGMGHAVGWGFQLQSAWVVAFLALLFFAIALNLLGLFEFTAASHLADARAIRALPKNGLAGSFSMGILTIIVASPCTAPFMGAALGYAVTQPTVAALKVFFMLGLGIATPWLLLTLMPRWTQWLPKPGPWMQVLRRCMALPMLLAALWLTWVLWHQVTSYGIITLFFAAGALTLLLWAHGREQYGRDRQRLLKAISLLVTVACLVLLASGIFTVKEQTVQSEQAFSEAALERALQSGSPVFVDFTASWCVTCQYNKVAVLHSPSVVNTFERLHYRRFVADWTSRNESITRMLNLFGRTGVPLYVIYDVQGKATVLPELLNQEELIAALKKAARH